MYKLNVKHVQKISAIVFLVFCFGLFASPLLVLEAALQANFLQAENQEVVVNENGSIDIELGALNQTPTDARIMIEPTGGTLSKVSTYVYTYTTTGFVGSDSFTFQLRDDRGRWTNTGTVSITVLNVNDAPIVQDFSVVTSQNTSVATTLVGDDEDGDVLEFTIIDAPVGTLSGSSPNLTYTPPVDFFGVDRFTYEASDGVATSNRATVTITVLETNSPPVAIDQSVLTFRNTPVAITLSAYDPDSDALVFTQINQTTNGTLSGSVPFLTYTPNNNYTGTDSFQFKVSDGEFDSNVAIVSITVDPTNDSPTALTGSAIVSEDDSVSITLQGSDPEGQPLSYSVTAGPSRGILEGSGDTYVYTPNADVNGSDAFYFRVSDGVKNSSSAKVSITIIPVNDPPTAYDKTLETYEDWSKSITMSATDVDGDPLTFVLVQAPSIGEVALSGDQLTYTPNANLYGSDNISYAAYDGTASSSPATVWVTVTSVNDAPVATAQEVVTDEDTEISFPLNASDVDGDPLTVSIAFAPSKGSVIIDRDLVALYTPNHNFSGTDSFTYKVTDGVFSTALTAVTIVVNEIVDIPVKVYSEQYAISEVPGDTTVLTNGNGAAFLPDGSLVFTYADAGDLYFGKELNPGQAAEGVSIIKLAQGVTPGSITALGDTVVIVYQRNTSTSSEMWALVSIDGGESFGEALLLGEKGPGAAVPSACLWDEMGLTKMAAAWISPETTDGDEGPLYLIEATINGEVSLGTPNQLGSSETFSAPSLSCDAEAQVLAVRDQVDDRLGIYLSSRSEKGWGTPMYQFYGADPSVCTVGNTFYLGYHDGNKPYLRKSSDAGGNWDEPLQLTEWGRFVNVACTQGGKVAAFSADWPSQETALDPAYRRFIGMVSADDGATWIRHAPVGYDVYQGPGTIDMNQDVIAAVIRDESRGVIRVAASKNTSYSGATVPLVMSIHMEPSGARECDVDGVRCASPEKFAHNLEKLKALISSLNQRGLTGTFEADVQWLERLMEDESGKETVKYLMVSGHEMALHHHGWDHEDWDGYSDNPQAYLTPHPNYPNLVAQPMSAYLEIVQAFEAEFGTTLRTIEATDTDYDWEGWDFKTTEATGDGWQLEDPTGACDFLIGEGRPTWLEVHLPNSPYHDTELSAWGLTHSHFYGFTPECQKVKADNVTAYLDGVDDTLLGTEKAVNLVFHVEDYADGDDIEAVFDSFFATIEATYPFMQGMGVAEYMCDRVGLCQ